MTFGVIEREEPFLAEMLARACESAGHDCLLFKGIVHVTRVLHAIRIDTIVLAIQRPGLNGLDWLETMAPSWPDLPSRTLLLTSSELTCDEVARIAKLGADVVATPSSFVDAKRVVVERSQKARFDPSGRAPKRASARASELSTSRQPSEAP